MTTIRTPSGVYLVTVRGYGGAPYEQLLVDTAGQVTDLSGAAVVYSDVIIVQGELRAAGAPELAERVIDWWRSR